MRHIVACRVRIEAGGCLQHFEASSCRTQALVERLARVPVRCRRGPWPPPHARRRLVNSSVDFRIGQRATIQTAAAVLRAPPQFDHPPRQATPPLHVGLRNTQQPSGQIVVQDLFVGKYVSSPVRLMPTRPTHSPPSADLLHGLVDGIGLRSFVISLDGGLVCHEGSQQGAETQM